MQLLNIEGLSGGYTEVDVLKGVGLYVEAQEVVTVVGTNGAGKSTLIKAIMGLLPRLEGLIMFAGRDLTADAAESRLKAGVGYVPQVANVFPVLTVLDNLLVVQGIAGVRQRAEEVIDVFPALKTILRRRAGLLSGGERQQLAFARALMSKPQMICLDEPTAALSPGMANTVFEHIVRLPGQGCAVLIVEQRAREALHISQRGYIMDQGRVAMSGVAASLLEDPRAVQLYLGHEA